MVDIFIVFKGRKHELNIEKTDNVKRIMEKFYNLINMNENERFYTSDKIIFKSNDTSLNDKEQDLYKTADQIGLMDDDTLTLIKTVEINAGKKLISYENNFLLSET